MATPTWWVGQHTLRIHAPATDTQEEGDSRTWDVTIARTYKPLGGNARTFTNNDGARWNPCEPITYRANLAKAWKGALGDIRYALHEISQASGLRFTYLGSTSYIPLAKRGGKYPGDSALNIGWTTPKKVPGLSGSVAGLGGNGAQTVGNVAITTSGEAVFDATERYRKRTPRDLKNLHRSLVMHEIAHAIGLDHVKDHRSIMHPALVRGLIPRFNAGDLLGLASLGADGGCLSFD